MRFPGTRWDQAECQVDLRTRAVRRLVPKSINSTERFTLEERRGILIPPEGHASPHMANASPIGVVHQARAAGAPLSQFFQRVAFCHSDVNEVPFAEGFNTQQVMLTEHNLVPALKASGAIPLLMQCEENIPGGPRGPPATASRPAGF